MDRAPEMANVAMPAISAACVDHEYAKCRSFVHLTAEGIFSNFLFLASLCFIPHLGLTPHFHLPVIPPKNLSAECKFVQLCTAGALTIWLSVD